jgi:hypothetical protein
LAAVRANYSLTDNGHTIDMCAQNIYVQPRFALDRVLFLLNKGGIIHRRWNRSVDT